MPRYLSLHSLACLTRQGAQTLTERLLSASGVSVRRIQVNTMEGKMLVEFEVPDRGKLEAWLSAEGFHYDWLWRIELEAHDGKLEQVP